MSMMSTLTKVAIGIMVARTAGKALGGSGGGGLGDMLGGLLGGKSGSGASNSTQGGGIGDILGNLMGGLGGSSAQGGTTPSQGGGIGDLLAKALAGEEVEPTPTEEEKAKVILKAMINAAKADGHMDHEEQKVIIEKIGDVKPEEAEFVKNEIHAPLDLEGVIKGAKGIEPEVYMMSLMTIRLDTQAEAEYLDRLARGLGLEPQAVNALHEKVGAPKLYS